MNGKLDKLYQATKDGRIAGVFSSAERARAAGYDEFSEIAPLLIDGSPDSGEYVFMAQGTWNVLYSRDGAFASECLHLGPCWGRNAQSAIYALSGQCTRRDVRLTALYLFRIDQPGDEESKVNLADEQPFSGLEYTILDGCRLPEEMIAADYLRAYRERLKKEEEWQERWNAPETIALSDRCAAEIVRQTDRLRAVFSTEYRQSILKENVRSMICNRFSLHEIELLNRCLRTISAPECAEKVRDLNARLAVLIPSGGAWSPQERFDTQELTLIREILCLDPRIPEDQLTRGHVLSSPVNDLFTRLEEAVSLALRRTLNDREFQSRGRHLTRSKKLADYLD